ncbi:MAG: hypothetical protein KGL50_06075 [Burkholderiales bacterium]|nr:hypothetical protein [Burkholderiales bacterium]
MSGLHEVDAERRASVAEDVIIAARHQHLREHRRPPALTAREALAALQFECLVVWTAAANIRAGTELGDEDFDRLTIAARRIDAIVGEVAS